MKISSGMLASKGIAEGTIVYLHSMVDICKVTSESIVVADKFSKEYTEAIVNCAAFITTRGGITSHAAITCRELRKPCIVSCINAFEIFIEGTKISLDATKMEWEGLGTR